jgi:ATP-dependent Clp protease protease subunit
MTRHLDDERFLALQEPDPEDEDDDMEEEHRGDDDDKLQEKVLKTRTVLVGEAISDEMARKVYQQIIVLEAESKQKPITVLINSPGGEADSGFGIFDMLRFVPMPVQTLVAGLCASAAVLVFMAGDTGKRFSLPHSRFLLHQPSSQSFGQASDLHIASKEILRLRDRYNTILAEIIGKDLAQINSDADRDFWLTAEDACEYGLVDRVVTRRAEME